MKLIIVFFIVTSAIIQIGGRAVEDVADKFSPEETCVNEVHVDRDEVQKETNNLATPEDNVLYGKFFACVWRKRGVMDEEGNIDSKGLRHALEILSDSVNSMDSINLARIDYVVTKCSKVMGDTSGQIGIKLKNCILEGVSKSS